MRPIAAIVASLLAAGSLSGGYLALGGGSYEPTPTADPCVARPWTDPTGVAELAEQIALSAFDGGACRLDVPREELVLAFRSRVELERFAARHGIADDEAVAAMRQGLDRAIDEAARNGALSEETATGLRALTLGVPLGALLAILKGTSLRW